MRVCANGMRRICDAHAHLAAGSTRALGGLGTRLRSSLERGRTHSLRSMAPNHDLGYLDAGHLAASR